MNKISHSSADAKWALPGLFLLLGVIYANWSARIPAIRDSFSLSPADLGNVLFANGIGAVLAFPLCNQLLSHAGPRVAARWSGLAMLIILSLLPLLPSFATLTLAAVCFGSATSCFDVAINALGAEAERTAERPIMSRLHAWFCAGTLIGALIGSAAAGAGLTPAWNFGLVNAALLLPLAACCHALASSPPKPASAPIGISLPHGSLTGLGFIVLIGAITEGSASSWIALYLQDHLRASEGVAPLGYAAFAGAMLVARLVCDDLKLKWGARRVLAASSALAALGFLLAVCASSVALAILGFAAAGIGVAALFPFVFSAAGRISPSALTAVATMGYAGSLLGPPMMGQFVERLGLTGGIWLLSGASTVLIMLALRTRQLV